MFFSTLNFSPSPTLDPICLFFALVAGSVFESYNGMRMTLMSSQFLLESSYCFCCLLLISLSPFSKLSLHCSICCLCLSLPSSELPLFEPSFPLFPYDFPPILVIEERVFIKWSNIPDTKQHLLRLGVIIPDLSTSSNSYNVAL